MRFTFTLEDWIFILRTWLDESYPLDLGKSHYFKVVRNRHYFGDFDPYGDFDLIFGAAKLNLKIVDIPIRYQARTYGETNINRWTGGALLLRMLILSLLKIKFV